MLQNLLINKHKPHYDLKESIPKGQGFFVEFMMLAGPEDCDHRLVKLRCPL